MRKPVSELRPVSELLDKRVDAYTARGGDKSAILLYMPDQHSSVPTRGVHPKYIAFDM